jgi:type VI secretion system protein ImpJ
MSSSAKILWGEGLFLRPQHFQSQDLYHENRLADLARAVHPYLWGLREIGLDGDALPLGILRLVRLRAVLPDGEFVHAPEADELPAEIDLTQIDDIGSGIVFHLGLPRLREHGANFSSAAQAQEQALRFYQRDDVVADRYTGAIDADISVLRKALRLLSDRDNRERYVCLPLLRIRPRASGGYEIDEAFMPPSLSIDASAPLHRILRRLLDMLQAKAQALYGYHREPSRNVVEFRSGDIASFWLLHTVNAAGASLQHLLHHAGLHPERLFQELLALAGQLMTFSKAYSLADLPSYRHDAPGSAFHRLDHIIRELLETVISSRYFLIPLTEVKASFHLGRVDSEKITSNAAYYLSVSADMPPAELVESVPQRVKLGAPDDVEKMVSSAMPGIRLMAAPQVPAPIPVRPGCYYFSVDPHGALYERMIASNAIMIYVPSGFRALKLELFAVTQ